MAKISKIIAKLIALTPKWFWLGFIAGLFYFGYIFFWLWSLYPLQSLGVENKAAALLFILFLFTITTAGMALFWGIFSFAVSKFYGKISLLFLPFLSAGVFVLTEYARAWFFGILWFGNGGMLGPHWTFGSPAYFFTGIKPILQTASFWGIYGMDLWAVFLSSSVILFLKTRRKLFLIWMSVAILTIPAINIFERQSDNQPSAKIGISIIQTQKPTKISYSPEETLRDFSQKLSLLKEAAKNLKENDIIIFPEGADFSKTLANFLDPFSVKTFFNKLSAKNLLVIDNNTISDSVKLRSKTTFTDSKSGIVGYYDKQLLAPAGEFLPYLIKWPLSIINSSLKNNLEDLREYSKGTMSNIVRYKNIWAKILVCSDIVSPAMARRGNFDFILAQNSLGIFNGSSLLESQLIAISRTRAVENEKYLALVSNFGRSFVIDSQGNNQKITDSGGYKILTGDIVPSSVQTWYNKLGDWPILALSLVFIACALFSKFLGQFFKKIK